VPEFIAEGYLASATSKELSEWGHGAGRVSDELDAAGIRVAHLGSIFVPSDQTCFSVFEAPSADAVAEICARAGIPCERVRSVVLSASNTRRHSHADADV